MKIVILGASSTLGQKLIEHFSPRNKTVGTFFSSSINSCTYKNIVHLDIERYQVTEKFILDFEPDVVIFLSQFKAKSTDPERLAREKNINCEALKNVSSICSTLGVKLVYLSSDHVLDTHIEEFQDESVLPMPRNSFAESKLAAEKFLQEQIPNHIILRTPYIYGHSLNRKRHDFLGQILNALMNNETIEVDNTIKRQFVLSDDVAMVIEHLVKTDEKGVYHVAPKEAQTSYEFASEIANAFSKDTSLIRPLDKKDDSLSQQPLIACESLAKLPTQIEIQGIKEGVRIFKQQHGCLFRMIYSVRPDMLVADQNASEFRIEAGKRLAIENSLPKNLDHIVPIPESGIYSATGLSAESKLPLYFGIIRDYFTEKTLYSSTTSNRYEKIKRKLIPIESLIKDKKIAIVDEAVLSGSTLKVMIQILRDVGAKEIHVRIPSPIIARECNARVLPKVNLLYPELSTDSKMEQKEYEEKLKVLFNADSFGFLSLDNFVGIPQNRSNFCTECFLR